METFSISLPEEQVLRLRERARQLGISVGDLLRFGVDELLAKPDDAFQRALETVNEKNSELYKRLA